MDGAETTRADPPPDNGVTAAQLGSRLGALRRSRGMTGEKLAGLVHVSQGKISKIERGVLRPSPGDVERIAVALGASDELVASLVREAEQIQPRGGGGRRRAQPSPQGPLLQQDYYLAEGRATLIRSFEPVGVPGLLQISEYTRRMLNAYYAVTGDDPRAHWKDTAEMVSLRTQRQERLYDTSKTFVFVMMEAVLANRFASPGYMLAQVDRIEQASALPNVTIHIVSMDTELRYLPPHGFVLFDHDVVFTESIDAMVHYDRRSVDFYTRFFESYLEIAEVDIGPILEKYKAIYAGLAMPRGDDAPP
ncbi:MAG: helix-turn-helix domain-containing protein, partial [Frankia sp.]|nr:helix-turn-helix domain-containing protein [Frankia sp.]